MKFIKLTGTNDYAYHINPYHIHYFGVASESIQRNGLKSQVFMENREFRVKETTEQIKEMIDAI